MPCLLGYHVFRIISVGGANGDREQKPLPIPPEQTGSPTMPIYCSQYDRQCNIRPCSQRRLVQGHLSIQICIVAIETYIAI